MNNLKAPERGVGRFDGKCAKMGRRHQFRSKQVRLWLSVIAYNLGNLCLLVLPRRFGKRPRTSLQQRPMKTGDRLVKHARYYWLLLAEAT